MSGQSCKDVEDLVGALCEGGLCGAGLELAREHVAECRVCAGRLAGLQAVRRSLASLPRLRPSRRFDLAVRARLAAEMRRDEALVGRARDWFARQRRVLLLALTPVVAGLALGLLSTGRLMSGAPPEPSDPRQPVLSAFGAGAFEGPEIAQRRALLSIPVPHPAANGDTAAAEDSPVQSIRLVRYVTF